MAEFQITPEFFWLGLMILCLVIEAATVGLATIWFAAGALAATAASVLGVGILGQILLFFTVSLVLLTFTRPFALKYISPHKIRTNYEDLVDQTVKITECVDNAADSGTAVFHGQAWSARMYRDDLTLKEGELAKVAAIKGVKLILAPLNEPDGKAE